MALVQCPECANQISDKAPACPKCGFPFAAPQKAVTPLPGKAVAAAQTSSFWLCPSCSKHAPTRETACRCGFVRPAGATAPAGVPRPTTITPQFPVQEKQEFRPSKTLVTLCSVGLVLAWAFKVWMDAGKGLDTQPQKVTSVPISARALGAEPLASPMPTPQPRILTPAEQVAAAAALVQQQKDQLQLQQEVLPVGDVPPQEPDPGRSQQDVAERPARQEQEPSERQPREQDEMEKAKTVAQRAEATRREYCADTNRANEISCFASNPRFCSDRSYSGTGACFMSNPPYCGGGLTSDISYGTSGACFASHPSYCSNRTYSDTGACFLSNPPYCVSGLSSDISYGASGACFASHPKYCSQKDYSDALACSGAKPPYCRSTLISELELRNTRACAGSISRPTRDEILFAARKTRPVADLQQLMSVLVRFP